MTPLAAMLYASLALVGAKEIKVGDNVVPTPGTTPLVLKVKGKVVGQANVLNFLKVLKVDGDQINVQLCDASTSTDKAVVSDIKAWILADDVIPVAEAIDFYAGFPSDHPDIYFVVVGLLYERAMNDPTKAVDYLGRAIKLKPDDTDYYLYRAHAWAELKNWAEMAHDLQELNKRVKPKEALKQTAQDAAELAKLSALKNPTADDKKKIAELEQKLAP